MKEIAVLAILTLVTLPARAQAPGDTITANIGFPKSYGAGYATFAIGASADFWKTVQERVKQLLRAMDARSLAKRRQKGT